MSEEMRRTWLEFHDKPKGENVGWRLLASRYLFRSQWHSLRQDKITLPDGSQTRFTYMEHPGAVMIIPVTKNQEFVLIRSYRYTVDEWFWEVPAGGLGDKDSKSPREVAEEELSEETGYTCETFEDLGWYYYSKGVANKRMHYFLARDVELTRQTRHEVGETIDEIRTFSVPEILKMIDSGELRDGDTVFSLMLALRAMKIPSIL